MKLKILPILSLTDIVHYLRHTCSQDLPTSSNLTSEQQTSLLSSLADLIHQTFEPYIGDELSDYLWLMEKLWLEWRRPVEIGAGEFELTRRTCVKLQDLAIAHSFFLIFSPSTFLSLH